MHFEELPVAGRQLMQDCTGDGKGLSQSVELGGGTPGLSLHAISL